MQSPFCSTCSPHPRAQPRSRRCADTLMQRPALCRDNSRVWDDLSSSETIGGSARAVGSRKRAFQTADRPRQTCSPHPRRAPRPLR
eukprot:190564-Rhodomonas_salina.2